MKTKKTLFVILPVLWVLLILINPTLGFLGSNKFLKSRHPFNFMYNALRRLRTVTMFFLIVTNVFLVLGLREKRGNENS